MKKKELDDKINILYTRVNLLETEVTTLKNRSCICHKKEDGVKKSFTVVRPAAAIHGFYNYLLYTYTIRAEDRKFYLDAIDEFCKINNFELDSDHMDDINGKGNIARDIDLLKMPTD